MPTLDLDIKFSALNKLQNEKKTLSEVLGMGVDSNFILFSLRRLVMDNIPEQSENSPK